MERIKKAFFALAEAFESQGQATEAMSACWIAINRIDHDKDLVNPGDRLSAIAQAIARLAWLAGYQFKDNNLPREGDYS